jgi:SAM-dependent methyltransferase
VLELGCGPAAGPSWFIAREGFSLVGIDGSATAISLAKRNFAQEGLKGEFLVGDLVALPWPENSFDCIVDVACLQCNDESDTASIVAEIHRLLKPGGRHFTFTLGSGTWGEEFGERVDSTTVRGITAGPLAGMGTNRFATREKLLELYARFHSIELNYLARSVENSRREIRDWVLTCSK